MTPQCINTDLDYYVRECGEIMGITGLLSDDSPASNGPMAILDHVFKSLVRFKMLNQVLRLGVRTQRRTRLYGLYIYITDEVEEL